MAENIGGARPQRLASIDALRGFDMFFIIGGGAIITALCKLWPCAFSDALAAQMRHVQWNGFAFQDMIFPLFLFIAGISFPFSFEKSLSRGMSIARIRFNIFKRALILVVLGVIYNNGVRFDFHDMRFCSVLGRIGLAWAFAAWIYTAFSLRARLIMAAAIPLAYWGILLLGDMTIEGNVVGALDRVAIPGRLYQKVFDPEGILSTIPAVCTAMLGIFAGETVRSEKFSPWKKTLILALAGIALVGLGLAWDGALPINKKLWTSSFVCFAGGISFLLFALFYCVVDVLRLRAWTFFFRVIGMNSITVYLAKRIVDFGKVRDFFFKGATDLLPAAYQPAAAAVFLTLTLWLFLYFLYRNNNFLKV
ncbi:MAG: DUF5009 domain-containing protein [Opitutales bacterium]|nr:DUF5009 domain-containing protein [Opitutales bacterium]